MGAQLLMLASFQGYNDSSVILMKGVILAAGARAINPLIS